MYIKKKDKLTFFSPYSKLCFYWKVFFIKRECCSRCFRVIISFSSSLSLLCKFTTLCLSWGLTKLTVISPRENGLIGVCILRENMQRTSLETVQNVCLFITRCVEFGSCSTVHRLTTAKQVSWIEVKDLILWQKATIFPTGCQGWSHL